MFENILGNEPIKAYLKKALEQNRLPHALLFSGIDGIGKSLFAKELSLALLETASNRLENHPDFHMARPEGKSALHSIESLRSLIDEVHSAPFEAKRKVFLIFEAERMQPAAANALLKTLEEPNPDTVLILMTSSASEMLPTILSRCVRLSFQPLSETEIASLLTVKGHPERLAKLAQGSAGKAFDLASRPSLEEPLFRLLAERPSLPKLLIALESLEELVEDEDPLRKSQNCERIFTSVLLWHRDQHARRFQIAPENLFFPEEPQVSFDLPSLDALQKKLDEARLAYLRNIKLSSCLYHVLQNCDH